MEVELNLYNKNGYALIHHLVYYNKMELLGSLFKKYSQFIDVNLLSIDGYSAIQLAVFTNNIKAVEALIDFQSSRIHFELNNINKKGLPFNIAIIKSNF